VASGNGSIKRFIIIATLGALLAGCAVRQDAVQTVFVPASPKARLDQALADTPGQMQRNRLAGLSIAVFDDYGNVQTRSFGVKRADGDQSITPTTAFSTASISKPVTALLCLLLDAEGRIDIDAPIAPSLSRWQLPHSEFSGTAEVTWRQLMTHTAGTSQHGFADYYEGDDLPTLVDSLEGRLPRYHRPIEFKFAPGTGWQYSGGGYVILQMALEDELGVPLHEVARQRIFAPLGMSHTTMIQPGEPGFPADVASVHDDAGTLIRTGLPITPQVSASGMWSTPTDLATFAIAIQRGLRGDTVGPVTPEIARTMTDIISLEYVGGMGTPFFRGFGLGNTEWFRHDGSNTGVNSDLFASMDGGYGLVLMGNGDDDNTGPVFADLRREIIGAMGWRDRHPIADAPIDDALRTAVAGDYHGLLYDLGLDYRIEQRGNRLVIASEFFTQFLGTDASPMHYLGDGTFRIEDYPNLLTFEVTSQGNVIAVTVSRPGIKAPAFRRSIEELR
tara:strand:- start:3725 stop:5233 length:1509 start_codon:yes stop_codon:yes gene_type:complete